MIKTDMEATLAAVREASLRLCAGDPAMSPAEVAANLHGIDVIVEVCRWSLTQREALSEEDYIGATGMLLSKILAGALTGCDDPDAWLAAINVFLGQAAAAFDGGGTEKVPVATVDVGDA